LALADEMEDAVETSQGRLDRYLQMGLLGASQGAGAKKVENLKKQVQDSISKLNDERTKLVLKGIGKAHHPDASQSELPFMKNKRYQEVPQDPGKAAVDQWKALNLQLKAMADARRKAEERVHQILEEEKQLQAAIAEAMASDDYDQSDEFFELKEASEKASHLFS